jgi:hypothetical protein
VLTDNRMKACQAQGVCKGANLFQVLKNIRKSAFMHNVPTEGSNMLGYFEVQTVENIKGDSTISCKGPARGCRDRRNSLRFQS